MKETEALFARFGSRIEIKLKSVTMKRIITTKCLFNQGISDIFKTEEKKKQSKTIIIGFKIHQKLSLFLLKLSHSMIL